MRKLLTLLTVPVLLFAFSVIAQEMKKDVGANASPEWSVNLGDIEACSCPMFCQCYFNSSPASHHEEGGKHFCRFNNAYKVNKGNYGGIKLDGAKFWMSGDLGGDFSQGKMDWVVLTFDKAMTPDQREAIKKIAVHLFPVQWNSFTTAEGNIDKWEYSKDVGYATLDGGKTAEVKIKRFQGITNEPVVIQNMRYWGVPRNDGFVLMPNEINAYHIGDKAFEFKGTNGFFITLDMNSNDLTKKM